MPRAGPVIRPQHYATTQDLLLRVRDARRVLVHCPPPRWPMHARMRRPPVVPLYEKSELRPYRFGATVRANAAGQLPPSIATSPCNAPCLDLRELRPFSNPIDLGRLTKGFSHLVVPPKIVQYLLPPTYETLEIRPRRGMTAARALPGSDPNVDATTSVSDVWTRTKSPMHLELWTRRY